MDILGYLASVLIGVSLGLIGSGGSILTVPVLVYLFGFDAISATTYSLFVVGITSTIGTVANSFKGLIRIKTALLFGLPSVITVMITRRFIVPAIPVQIIHTDTFSLSKASLLLLIFAVLMLYSSYKMIRREKISLSPDARLPDYNYLSVLWKGSFVGLLTGLVGAGGGFLIVPVLVLKFKLPIQEAVGTSLLIICVNSLLGFSTSVNTNFATQWNVLLMVSLSAIVGIFVGLGLSRRISGAKLKPLFGWFVLVMGTYIILKETVLH